ncbi:hypothetical protein CKM354_000899500 [Cercospora kikuchii]|uniref:Histone-lysine N-methyltransferase, H3 lysine-79 specific n=1 Tax=Cercospora kikuchii TaxID=84275 RepID=A0A9P3CSH4_9PEZI|nr:uncharacterized protein CKM354_000899500 [Cercospora kikuchii]GIZ45845.1 hypothetical protein CKM354_000899500 [Cercospora kikuchii]
MGIMASMMTRNQKRKQQTESFNNAHQEATNASDVDAIQELRTLLRGGHADFVKFLPLSPTHQDEPMGRYAGLFLAKLHHSADNYDPAPNNSLYLRYPSGAIERFTLSKRSHRHTHRHARPLKPIKDIIRTIQVFHIQAGTLTSSEIDTMGRMIEKTFEHFADTNNFHPLQRLIGNLTHPAFFPSSTHLPLPPPFDLTTHFLAQLHDRIIADAAHNLSRPSTSNTESTYGELLPPFLRTLFLQTNLNETSTYLDLGSGVGQTCLQASLTTGCLSYGIERESRSAGLAALHLAQFHERATLWGLTTEQDNLKERVIFKLGDFLKLECVKDWLQEADVVLVNNLKLEPETDLALVKMLSGKEGVKRGTKVVSTRPFVMVGRTRGRSGSWVGGKRKRGLEDDCEVGEGVEAQGKRRKIAKGKMNERREKMAPTEENEGENAFMAVRCGEDEKWTWKEYVYEAGSVSWSNESRPYYISVRK